jgi:hypothetical protein
LTSCGREIIRWNIVGTRCVCVIRCCSINRSVSSASHLSMRTTPAPLAIGMLSEKASGAAWYSGPVTRFRSSPATYSVA